MVRRLPQPVGRSDGCILTGPEGQMGSQIMMNDGVDPEFAWVGDAEKFVEGASGEGLALACCCARGDVLVRLEPSSSTLQVARDLVGLGCVDAEEAFAGLEDGQFLPEVRGQVRRLIGERGDASQYEPGVRLEHQP